MICCFLVRMVGGEPKIKYQALPLGGLLGSHIPVCKRNSGPQRSKDYVTCVQVDKASVDPGVPRYQPGIKVLGYFTIFQSYCEPARLHQATAEDKLNPWITFEGNFCPDKPGKTLYEVISEPPM